MGMFDNFQAPNPPGYPQGQPNTQQQPNFGSDPRQALAMAMMKQGQQQISPQAGATGGALTGISNTMNSPMGMMALQKMFGNSGVNWNTPRMDPSQFAQPMNIPQG